jgi:hypothetical protein
MNEVEFEVIKEHIQLLERQCPIAGSRSRPQQPEKENDRTSPFVGKSVSVDNLVGSSLLSTLQYCCRYNWDAPENLLASPMGLKKAFRLTERQFVWNAFIGRILMNEDPIQILLVKVKMAFSKFKCLILSKNLPFMTLVFLRECLELPRYLQIFQFQES